MPATLPHIDPQLFTKLKSGDEKAFERLFRERYAALLEEATPLLDGDGASAARGIETVFEQLWRDHEDLTTPEQLESAIVDAVHEAAARIKSRHAVAQHFGNHGTAAHKAGAKPAPTADEAWSKVYGTLHVDEKHQADVAREMVEHSRHEVAEQVGALTKPRRWTGTIIAAVLLLGGLGGLWWWANRGHEIRELTTALAGTGVRTTETVLAQVKNVTLGDGTFAQIGPESRLLVPPDFGTSIRGLQVIGTANFKVAPDPKHRFLVRAGKATITATGTAFAVRAYRDENDVTVRVDEGSVTVTLGDTVRSLAKGAGLVIAQNGSMHDATAAELDQALGWTSGSIVMTDRTLRDVLVVAKRWYGLELYLIDTSLANRKLNFSAKVNAPDDALQSIQTNGKLTKVWKGQNMVLEAKK